MRRSMKNSRYMTKDMFTTMTKVTPDNFQFSIKVTELVTHDKRLDVQRGAVTYHEGWKRTIH